LGCLWSGYHYWYYINETPALPSKEPYTKCILGYSALINHAIWFHSYSYFAVGSNVSYRQMELELHLLTL
jgi:hypothetical protein